MRARSAPARTALGSAGPPSSIAKASITMLLPAPVSPVSAMNPSPKVRRTCSATATLRMSSSCSMTLRWCEIPRRPEWILRKLDRLVEVTDQLAIEVRRRAQPDEAGEVGRPMDSNAGAAFQLLVDLAVK